jgi:hypothetical protein
MSAVKAFTLTLDATGLGTIPGEEEAAMPEVKVRAVDSPIFEATDYNNGLQ